MRRYGIHTQKFRDGRISNFATECEGAHNVRSIHFQEQKWTTRIFYATSSMVVYWYRWPSDRRRRHDAIVGSNSRYFIIQRQHVTFAYTLRM